CARGYFGSSFFVYW
nr:immunoglobulin heavy chain junction region [Mus musculus]